MRQNIYVLWLILPVAPACAFLTSQVAAHAATSTLASVNWAYAFLASQISTLTSVTSAYTFLAS